MNNWEKSIKQRLLMFCLVVIGIGIVISMSGCPSEVCECGNNIQTIVKGSIPLGAGNVSLSPDKPSYTRGEFVTATFTPAENYKIDYWIDSSGWFNLFPANQTYIWVTENIILSAVSSWNKRKIHVYWNPNTVNVTIPGDAIEQGSSYFIVERDVDSLATFAGEIRNDLPPLPPGLVRKMIWERINMPTPVGQRWDETGCSVIVEGPSSPQAQPMYVRADIEVVEESLPTYSVEIFPIMFNGEGSWQGTIYCNRCPCNICSCLAVFPYDYANSAGIDKKSFSFFMEPTPNLAFVLWLSDIGYNLQQSTGYTFPGDTGGDKNIFGICAERIHLSPSVEGQGVIRIVSGKYNEVWGYDPLPFNVGGDCSGWAGVSIENCANIIGNEVKLKAEPCNRSWEFDYWEYYDEDSQSWISLSHWDNLTAYMNWWGDLDPVPNRIHVPWGTTSYRIKAVFRQLSALVVESKDVPPIPYLVADDYLSAFCYRVEHLLSCGSETEVLEKVTENDIFCYNGHGSYAGYLGLDSSVINDETIIEPSEVEQYNGLHPYKFVYLKACCAGWLIEAWREAFNAISAIGFEEPILTTVAYQFDIRFWEKVFVDGYDTFEAARKTQDELKEAGYGNVPLVTAGVSIWL